MQKVYSRCTPSKLHYQQHQESGFKGEADVDKRIQLNSEQKKSVGAKSKIGSDPHIIKYKYPFANNFI